MQMLLRIFCSQAATMPVIYRKMGTSQVSWSFQASIGEHHPGVLHSVPATLVFRSISFDASQYLLLLT
uniref:Uncharacterized protein n=1 Tax=Arundo donax TaxID=35708 RepID=A0A0A9DP68_ARUDO